MKTTCDADNMALHFQTYYDDGCSQLVPNGAQSIGTNQCTTIFGVGQEYSCVNSAQNMTAMTESILAKNAFSATLDAKVTNQVKTVIGKTVNVQQWNDDLGCQGSPDITPSFPDQYCAKGNPYYMKTTCDADNMALHFQTYYDDGCSQLVPDGAQSIGTNQCTTIFGVGQKYSCVDSAKNMTAVTETVLAKNAFSVALSAKSSVLV